MAEIELKPCPFCGGDKIGFAETYAFCPACASEGPFCDEHGRARAALWNARPIEDDLRHQVAQSRAEATILRVAVKQARAQFQFYADEHTKAGKTDKAATNQGFADRLAAALAPHDVEQEER